MKTKTITSVCLAFLAILLPSVAEAEAKPNKQHDVAFAKLANEKRLAIIGLNVEHAPNQHQPFLGVFISSDGLGLVNLASLARQQKPKAYVNGRTEINLGTILGIFPELEMALVKFDYRPKVWLKVAEKEPEVDENLKLKALALTDPLLMDPAKPLVRLKNFHPDPKASKADQIAVLRARAGAFLMRGDMAGAVRELEAAIQPNLAPPDFSEHRFMLAEGYTQTERFEKAEAFYRQIYPFNSDSIDVLSGFQKVLYRLGKFEEADRLADREYELTKIYRRR